MDAALVTEVEAEIRAAMAVPPAAAPNDQAEVPAPAADSEPATAAIVTPTPPTPVATAPVKYVTDHGNFTGDELRAAGWNDEQIASLPIDDSELEPTTAVASGITTLPELMAAATSAGKTPEEMLAAANKAGLAAVPLLGARPDLVPTVAAELGLTGG